MQRVTREPLSRASNRMPAVRYTTVYSIMKSSEFTRIHRLITGFIKEKRASVLAAANNPARLDSTRLDATFASQQQPSQSRSRRTATGFAREVITHKWKIRTPYPCDRIRNTVYWNKQLKSHTGRAGTAATAVMMSDAMIHVLLLIPHSHAVRARPACKEFLLTSN